MDKKTRLLEVQRMMNDGITVEAAATKLGVSPRTIKNDRAYLRLHGKIPKREVISKAMLKNPVVRDALLDTHLDTVSEIRWAIGELREFITALKLQVLQHIEAGKLDGVMLSSYAKTFDTLTNQLTLKGKLLQEITDAPQLSIAFIDGQVANTIAVLMRHTLCPHCGQDTHIANELYNELMVASPAQARRMPEFIDIEPLERLNDGHN
jgi:hypothetical protein